MLHLPCVVNVPKKERAFLVLEGATIIAVV